MLKMIRNENDRVLTIKFPDDRFIRSWGDRILMDHDGKHEDLALAIAEAGYETYSVIVLCGHLRSELYQDPMFCTRTSHHNLSRLEEDARREEGNHYYTDEEVQNIIDGNELSLIKNWGDHDDSKENLEFRMKIKDYIYANKIYRHFPVLLERFKEECSYKVDELGYCVEDEEGEPIPLSDDDAEKQYQQLLPGYISPRTGMEAERNYAMPAPFSHWDRRNHFQQFFFVEAPPEEGKKHRRIQVSIGGSGSSGSRQTQGLWAHAFAHQAKYYDVEAPTWFLVYNRDNELMHVKESSRFHAFNRELGGNYQRGLRGDDKDELFKGRLVGSTRSEDYEKEEFDFNVDDDNKY